MSQTDITSSNARREGNFFLLQNYTSSPLFVLTQTRSLTDVYAVTEEDITEDEKKQLKKNRQDIAEGKATLHENVDEYLKSLDNDE